MFSLQTTEVLSFTNPKKVNACLSIENNGNNNRECGERVLYYIRMCIVFSLKRGSELYLLSNKSVHRACTF